ncbi:hypothetical protein D9M70_513400 [compost metagenome]
MGGEVQRFDELLVAVVGQLVGEGVVLVDAFGQHLAHESLGIGHVFETVGLHRIVVEPGIGKEIVDRFDVADLRQVVLRLARHIRLLGNAGQRLRQVGRYQLVARVGRGHDRFAPAGMTGDRACALP